MAPTTIPLRAERPVDTRLAVLTAIGGGMLTVIVTWAALTAIDNNFRPSPLMLAPFALAIAAVPFYWLRVDFPKPAIARLRAPLDPLALGLLTLSMMTMTLNGVRAAGTLAVSDVFLLLAAAAATPALFDRRLGRQFMLPVWITVPALLISLVGLISIVFLDDSLVSLAGLLRLIAAMTLVPLVLGAIGGEQRALVWLVDMWIVSAMINSAVAIGDFGLQLGIGERITHVISAGRSTGLTTHSNHLGVAMCMTTPLVLGRMVVAKTRVLQYSFFLALCVLGLAVLSTGSRGALVGYVLAVLIGTAMLPAAIRRKTWKWVFVAGIAGMLMAGAAFRGEALNSIERITGGGAEVRAQVSDSDEERSGAREAGIQQFVGNPLLGAGLVNAQDAHLIYLQLAASTGVVGLTAFLIFLVGSVASSRRVIRDPNLDLESAAIVAAAGAAVVVWAVLGLVENQLADRYLYVPSGLIVAGLWYRTLTRAEREENNPPSANA
ncbi:MAG: O-antigen ligase family protein [Thermoleophilaceae bacterium]|nr:O-antigen ligase family protein [Thermoleophilaceae bacterium]